MAFKLTNATLIIGCILLSIFPTLPPPLRLSRLLSIYNGLSQCAAVELHFCLSPAALGWPTNTGLFEERLEAAERLQRCGLKQPASDKQQGPPGVRGFEIKTLSEKKRKPEMTPECSSWAVFLCLEYLQTLFLKWPRVTLDMTLTWYFAKMAS